MQSNTCVTVNAIGQLFLLNFLLGADGMGVNFIWYGIHIMQLIIDGKDIGENSRVFPRITMCDFTIRQFSNLQV